MKKAFFKLMMCAGTVSILLAGCAQENVYDPNAVTKKYENAWEKTFGKIDPNQTWNTATRVTVTANMPYITGKSEMRIYTSNPLENGCALLSQTELQNGAGNIAFDIPGNLSQVYVSIMSEGLYRANGYYAIENGIIYITPTSRQTKKVATRADGDCKVTKGAAMEIEVSYNTEEATGYTNQWGGDYKSFKDWEDYYKELGTYVKYQNNGPYTTESIAIFTEDEWGNPISVKFDFSNPVLKDGVKLVYTQKKVALTPLTGVDRAAADPWELGWGYTMFGPDSFFAEYKKYYETPKYGTLYYSDELKKIEAGFSMTSKGGEIHIPFIYGATQNSNQLGYVYYKDGQDPLSQPHYILIADATPKNNIYYNSWQGDKLNENMSLANWKSDEPGAMHGYPRDTKMYGTQYTLAFFGENHDQTPTYNFPAGYRIVFFIYQTAYIGNFNYSLPELNLRIGHKNGNPAPSQQDIGAVKAASWSFKGYTFVGFEDGGSDEDLNDIVFRAEGAYDPGVPPVVVPDPNPTPTPGAQSWLLACEDLGNTDDFDFNDIVFSVSHVAGTTEATVTPLAAGGTLEAHIYYGNQDLGEIHQLLGQSGYTITNTNGSKGTAGEARKITVPENFSMTENMGGFKVSIKRNEKEMVTINAPENGTAPQMICIDNSTNWAWPIERTNISEAYPDFGEWGANYSTNPEWYKSPLNDKVVK